MTVSIYNPKIRINIPILYLQTPQLVYKYKCLVYMTDYYQKLKGYLHNLFLKYIQKVKFYPSTDNFIQALLVMLVTNTKSGSSVKLLHPSHQLRLTSSRLQLIGVRSRNRELVC